MGIVKLKKGKHILRDLHFVHFLRRRLRDPDLVTYYNMDTGMWVLAYWLHKPSRTVDEIDDLGPRLEYATPELVWELAASRKTVGFDHIRKRLINKKKERLVKLAEDQEEYRDTARFLKRRNIPLPMFY